MWFVWWDACGLACFLFGELTMIFCNYSTVFEIILPWFGASSPWAWVNIIAFEALLVLVHWSHWMAAVVKPGHVVPGKHSKAMAVPEEPEEGPRMPDRRYCSKCSSLRPQRAHHCSICGVCVMKMDHHCPWINNCLGMNNHKFFLQFLAYVCIGCVYAAGMHGANVAWCMSTKQCPRPSPNRLVIGVVAGVLAVFFAIFVIAMMCDQYEALVTDTTGIEAMKKWDLDKIPIDRALVTIFGEPPSVNWILPTEMPEETAFNHDKWELADYDEWDERDPLLRAHYDQVKGFDWIDDTTQFRYSVETVLGALNAGVPKGARSRYVVGKDGYPELRVFPGEEKLFPELGDDDAAAAPSRRSTTTTTTSAAAKKGQEGEDEDVGDAREADLEASGAAAGAGPLDEEDIDLIGCKRPATSPEAARGSAGAEKPNEDDVKLLD